MTGVVSLVFGIRMGDVSRCRLEIATDRSCPRLHIGVVHVRLIPTDVDHGTEYVERPLATKRIRATSATHRACSVTCLGANYGVNFPARGSGNTRNERVCT